MNLKKKIKNKISEKYIKSKYFRETINFFGIGISGGIIYASTPATCPCCGNIVSSCPIGIIGAGIVGGIIAIFYSFLRLLKELYSKIKKIIYYKN
jgi:hypothetical protein